MSFGVRYHDDLVAQKVVEPLSTFSCTPNGKLKPSVQRAQLSNRVHRIWSYSRFSQQIFYSRLGKEVTSCLDKSNKADTADPDTVPPLPPEVYDRLKPALRLATIFLQRSLYFLHVVRNAPTTESMISGSNGSRARRHFVRAKLGVFTASQKAQILRQLDDLVKRYYIIGECYSKNMDCIAQTMQYGCSVTKLKHRTGVAGRKKSTTANDDIENVLIHPLPLCVPHPHSDRSKSSTETSPSAISPSENGRMCYSIITCMPKEAVNLLSTKYPVPPDEHHSTSTTFDLWPMLPKGAQDRTLFLLAVTFVHELVHALFYDRDADGLHSDEEVYFDPHNDAENELGFAWEKWMFGGIVHSIDGEISGGGGDVAYIRYAQNSSDANAEAGKRTRSQTKGRQPTILVTLPTYGVAWKLWRHTKSYSVTVAKDGRLIWYLERDNASLFLNKKYMTPWTEPEGWRFANIRCLRRKTEQSHSIQLSIRPIAARFGVPYWRGRGSENRDSFFRERAWIKYDTFLQRMHRTGAVWSLDDDKSDPWLFEMPSEYSDNGPSPPRSGASGSGSKSSGGDSWRHPPGLDWHTVEYYAAEYGAVGGGEHRRAGLTTRREQYVVELETVEEDSAQG